jgi:histidyl-tRNA synthetase
MTELELPLQARGTRIIVDDTKSRRKLLNQLIEIVDREKFNEIILPSVELAEIYKEKAGVEILNQMYVFADKKDRMLCLRPEGTATIQLIADKYYNNRKDVKLWYFEKCYRYERPQKGRYREFWQFGVEILKPSQDYTSYLIKLAEELVQCVTSDYVTTSTVKRGLAYYVTDGFEIAVDSLGAQKQVCGGGAYKQGIGFAIGFDRLMLCMK